MRHVIATRGIVIHDDDPVVRDDAVVRDVLKAVISRWLAHDVGHSFEAVLGLETLRGFHAAFDVDQQVRRLVLVGGVLGVFLEKSSE